MIFIDSSAYLAFLLPEDGSKMRANVLKRKVFSSKEEIITTYPILGEVLTIGSMRFNRKATIQFVDGIFASKPTIVPLENKLFNKSFILYQKIKNKDVSWVDCLSFAIIEEYKIPKVFSFDKDFKTYAKAEIIS